MTATTIAHLLGGRSVLKRNVRTDSELIAAVRDGLPFLALRHLFDEFASTDLAVQEMYALVGSLRTLQRKQAARTRLTAAESDRVARVARVLARAEEAIGDKARARLWLTEPTAALGGRRPVELLDSDLGTGQVERVLGRIEYGVYEQSVLIYRLSRSKHPALDGEGARLYGGRWNSAGRPVVYASATVSLAALERLVHLSLKTLPPDLVAYGIDVPDDLAVPTLVVALPADWRTPGCAACRDAGDAWLVAGTSAVLRAPSAVVAGEFNFLVNPLHADITRLVVRSTELFAFDARLSRR